MDDFDAFRVQTILKTQSEANHASYSDLRIETVEKKTILRNNQRLTLSEEFDKGMGLRILKEGRWSFLSQSGIEEDFIEKAYLTANHVINDLSLRGSGKIRLSKGGVTDNRSVYLPDHNRHVQDESELIAYLESLWNSVENFGEKWPSRVNLSLTNKRIQKWFFSSEGAMIYQSKVYYLVKIAVQNESAQRIMYISSKAGNLGNPTIEALRTDESVIKTILQLSKQAENATIPKTGDYPVVFSPLSAWMILHEVFGHAIEGDTVIRDKSILSGKQGFRIASEHVTIVDDPTIPSLGSYAYDDDGIKGSGTQLIEEGLLLDFLHSRETAGKEGTVSTGNSIAQDYAHFPLVRMSNIYIEPGDWTMEELLDFTGVYVDLAAAGSSQPYTGEYRLPVMLGFWVENGEIKRALHSFNVVGNMFNFLGRIEGIGNSVQIHPTYCGKANQDVLQAAISPHLLVSKCHLIGRG